MKYIGLICGGRGPDVWDKEVEVEAENIRQALDEIEKHFLEYDSAVVSIEQKD